MADGGLLCIPQPTHALTAAQFCRHWGNDDFARPQPADPVLLAIAQHDSGWIDWERAPRLRPDGLPMDFIHFTDVAGKADIWRKGVALAWGQHPYAAVLIARHASLLYAAGLDRLEYRPDEQAVLDKFFADEQAWQEKARRLFCADECLTRAMRPQAIDAHTRLLQFGDRAALQIGVPWGQTHTLANCPTDLSGGFTSIRMTYDDETISFDPWPFRVAEFTVAIEGYRLPRRTFPDEAAYHQALADAAYYRRTWRVARPLQPQT